MSESYKGWERVYCLKDAISKSMDRPISFENEIFLRGKVVLQWSKPVSDAMDNLTNQTE